MPGNAKKKILYLITKDDVGGAQKYVADLANNLDKTKFEVKILTGGPNGVRFLSNALRPHFLFINDWLALIEIFFKLRKIKPDVVHLNSSKAGVIGAIAAKLAGIPKVVFTAHGWVFNPDNEVNPLMRQFYIWLHKIVAIFQDKIINVSEYDRQLALKHKIASSEKLIAIHNGIDYEKIGFLEKNQARKKLLAKEDIDGIWVGSVGRLVKEKGYENFVTAAAQIKDRDIKFLIIGNGYEKQKLQSLIKRFKLQDRFFLIENLSPAVPYLKAFNIFVSSSIKEGLPYTILEAMAAGLPIVATRVGGLPEIMETRTSKNGIIMPPREPAELARAIQYLINNPQEAQELAKNATDFLRGNLSIGQMILATAEIYY